MAALAGELLEWLYVYDPEGRQIARFHGTTDEVDLSDELKARIGPLGLYGEAVLKDHVIVHNHPARTGDDPVRSFPPSSSDLTMAAECDLQTLVVISGGIRYAVRRPGPVWPFDEELLAAALRAINDELDEDDLELTRRGSVERQETVLRHLDAMGVIDYEKVA